MSNLLGLSKDSKPKLIWSEQLEDFLRDCDELTDEACTVLLYTWSFWARDDQLPPPVPWRTWVVRSGRGAGKTRTGSEWALSRVEEGFGYLGLVGETSDDCREVIVEGPPGILKSSPPWNRPKWVSSRGAGYLLWNNGATARLFSGDDPDQLRGPGLDTIWLDELAKYKHPVECLSNARFTLRECSTTDDPKMLITTTPRPIPVIIRQMWDAVQRLGFSGGRILEPAAGIGHFIGAAPENLRSRLKVTAIELDLISGRIAQTLYGRTDVKVRGFQETSLADSHYDLAISNVPFGDYRIDDPQVEGSLTIHNYYFLKTASFLRSRSANGNAPST